MERYFDFDHNFKEALIINKEKNEMYKHESVQAWNKQVNINRDLSLLARDYKQIDKITSLMEEFKGALQEKWGKIEGINKYNEMFLENEEISEKEAARHLYNALHYSVAFGADGKNLINEFIKDDDIAMKKVVNSLQTVFPNMDSRFINEIVKEYKDERVAIWKNDLHNNEGMKTANREEQIKFVKENIDSMYTNTQRFKEVWSEAKKFYIDEINPIAAIITAPIVLPVMVASGMVKVFGGEAGEMKMHDVIDSVGKNLEAINKKVNEFTTNVTSFLKLSVKDKIHAMRRNSIEDNLNKDNRFKM